MAKKVKRIYTLPEARKLIEYQILAKGGVFDDLDWFLGVTRAVPTFAERKDHHYLDEKELGEVRKAIEGIIANRTNK